jgi:hypothetical protein
VGKGEREKWCIEGRMGNAIVREKVPKMVTELRGLLSRAEVQIKIF